MEPVVEFVEELEVVSVEPDVRPVVVVEPVVAESVELESVVE